jgi:sterol desaturase/sphingolipid hydroxylase (fatty acid hydroxylase superfamily)
MIHTVLQVAAVFGTFALLELLLGRFPFKGVARHDDHLDLAAFSQASLLVGPIVVWCTAQLTQGWLPAAAGVLADLPWWGKIAAFLVFEDLVQYTWHRASHTAWLWPLHKFHHTPEYMGVRIVWRNSFLYDLLMPNFWTAGILVYLGMGDVYFWYCGAKMVVQMGAHSTVCWDAPLYRIRWLHPVMWVVERVIVTPAFHHAHHAATQDDGIGHYQGNYGNLMALWDVLFGTARITRRYPGAYGLGLAPGEQADPWHVLMFYPLSRPTAGPAVPQSLVEPRTAA